MAVFFTGPLVSMLIKDSIVSEVALVTVVLTTMALGASLMAHSALTFFVQVITVIALLFINLELAFTVVV
jgi:hypothetical protein